MRRDFEGGVYWDELADRCSDISRAAGFRGAARFRGNTVCESIILIIPYHSVERPIWVDYYCKKNL